MSQRLVRLCPGRRLLEDSAASRKNAVLLSQPPASIITLKTCRNNSLCRIRFDVGFEIIEAKRMGTLLRTHHDTLPGRVLNMSTHRPSSSVSAQTEELPCHKPPHGIELKRRKLYDRQPTGKGTLRGPSLEE